MLHRPLHEVMTYPEWEFTAWRVFFNVYGPIDYERQDYLNARDTYIQCAKKNEKIEDYLLFKKPETEEQKTAKYLHSFGLDEKTITDLGLTLHAEAQNG